MLYSPHIQPTSLYKNNNYYNIYNTRQEHTTFSADPMYEMCANDTKVRLRLMTLI